MYSGDFETEVWCTLPTESSSVNLKFYIVSRARRAIQEILKNKHFQVSNLNVLIRGVL